MASEVVAPCLHTFTREEVLACEAEGGYTTPGFPCPICERRCNQKATDLLELSFTNGERSTAPTCDCEEGPATVHCNDCGVHYCGDCDAGAHRGARRLHVRIPIVTTTTASRAIRQEIVKFVSLAANALVKVSAGVAAVNKRHTEVCKSKDETHKKVQQTYKKVQAQFIAQMKVVQSDALAEGGRKEDALSKQKDALETAQERLESGIDLANRVIKSQ